MALINLLRLWSIISWTNLAVFQHLNTYNNLFTWLKKTYPYLAPSNSFLTMKTKDMATFKMSITELVSLETNATSIMCLFIFYVRLEAVMLMLLMSEIEMRMLKFSTHL